jgi:hypothetical protein
MWTASKPVERRDAAKAAEMPAADCALCNRCCLGRRLIVVWDRLTLLSDFRTVIVATDRD